MRTLPDNLSSGSNTLPLHHLPPYLHFPKPSGDLPTSPISLQPRLRSLSTSLQHPFTVTVSILLLPPTRPPTADTVYCQLPSPSLRLFFTCGQHGPTFFYLRSQQRVLHQSHLHPVCLFLPVFLCRLRFVLLKKNPSVMRQL